MRQPQLKTEGPGDELTLPGSRGTQELCTHGQTSRNQSTRNPTTQNPGTRYPRPVTDMAFAGLGATATRLERAAIQVARFDGEMSLTQAPFATTSPWVEGMASARLARIYDTPQRVWLAELGRGRWRMAAWVVATVRATRLALEIGAARDLGELSLRRLNSAVLGKAGPVVEEGWDERTRALVTDLAAFMARDDLPVLAQAAVVYGQLVTRRPFAKANGRTARAVAQCLMRAKGLTSGGAIPISAVFVYWRHDLAAALRAFHRGDPMPLLELYARGSMAAVAHARHARQRQEDLVASWSRLLGRTRNGSSARRILPYLIDSPVFYALQVAAALQVSPEVVHKACAQLERLAIIQPLGPRKRYQKLWCAPEALAAMNTPAGPATGVVRW